MFARKIYTIMKNYMRVPNDINKASFRAQIWITQCYLQTTTYLLLPVSIPQAA